jgi:hypothetical protein
VAQKRAGSARAVSVRQQNAASYLADMLSGLKQLAYGERLELLGYFIAMAEFEALSILGKTPPD